MIEVMGYIIEAYEYGYAVYRKDKVYTNPKTGEKSVKNQKYAGTIEDCLKIVMRECIHDYVFESNYTLTLNEVLKKIIEIERTINKSMMNA